MTILYRIRTSHQTAEDISHLRTRLTSGNSHPVQLSDPKFCSALYLLPHKEQVEAYMYSVSQNCLEPTLCMRSRLNTVSWNPITSLKE